MQMPQTVQPARFQEEGGEHRGIDAGVRAAAEDRGGVLGAPPADGHVDDGDVNRGEDGEDGCQGVGLAGRREPAQHQIADIEEPEQKHAGKARIPRPPDSPSCARPEHAGEEADAGVDDRHFGSSEGEGVGGKGFEGIAAAPVKVEE